MWEGRGAFIFYVDLVGDVLIHVLWLGQYAYLWCMHRLCLHLLDFVVLMDCRSLFLTLVARITWGPRPSHPSKLP
jgi:hypothetical protein